MKTRTYPFIRRIAWQTPFVAFVVALVALVATAAPSLAQRQTVTVSVPVSILGDGYTQEDLEHYIWKHGVGDMPAPEASSYPEVGDAGGGGGSRDVDLFQRDGHTVGVHAAYQVGPWSDYPGFSYDALIAPLSAKKVESSLIGVADFATPDSRITLPDPGVPTYGIAAISWTGRVRISAQGKCDSSKPGYLEKGIVNCRFGLVSALYAGTEGVGVYNNQKLASCREEADVIQESESCNWSGENEETFTSIAAGLGGGGTYGVHSSSRPGDPVDVAMISIPFVSGPHFADVDDITFGNLFDGKLSVTYYTESYPIAPTAAVNWDDDVNYFYSEDQYLRFDIAADQFNAGYPLPMEGHWAGWPADFVPTAAVNWGNGVAYFFSEDMRYIRFDMAADQVSGGYPRNIVDQWAGWPADFVPTAAVNWGNGVAYFFNADMQHLRFDVEADQVSGGYPRDIVGQWAGWPADFVPTAAVNWGNGVAYFFNEDQYLRFDIAADQVNSGYPLPIQGQWAGWPGE